MTLSSDPFNSFVSIKTILVRPFLCTADFRFVMLSCKFATFPVIYLSRENNIAFVLLFKRLHRFAFGEL